MRIVINTDFGGFRISEDALAILSTQDVAFDTNFISADDVRTNAALIALIDAKGAAFVGDSCSSLSVVTIPDDATDWIISDYDGCETLIYVKDGKIHQI